MGKLGLFMSSINHNIPTTWRWARRDPSSKGIVNRHIHYSSPEKWVCYLDRQRSTEEENSVCFCGFHPFFFFFQSVFSENTSLVPQMAYKAESGLLLPHALRQKPRNLLRTGQFPHHCHHHRHTFTHVFIDNCTFGEVVFVVYSVLQSIFFDDGYCLFICVLVLDVLCCCCCKCEHILCQKHAKCRHKQCP